MQPPAKKNPWHDRFADPRTDDLRDLYGDAAPVLDQLLDLVETRTAARPATEWRGIAWRWTLVYTRPSEEEPWAYVIPSQPHPSIALPAPVSPLPPSEFKKLPRFIRDTVLHAPRVGQVRWIQVPVESKNQVAELDRFIGLITEAQPA